MAMRRPPRLPLLRQRRVPSARSSDTSLRRDAAIASPERDMPPIEEEVAHAVADFGGPPNDDLLEHDRPDVAPARHAEPAASAQATPAPGPTAPLAAHPALPESAEPPAAPAPAKPEPPRRR